MIDLVVAVDNNFGIGRNNELLMRIPDDMRVFKNITINETVIMGRKTYESIPNAPLHDRANVVITSQVSRRKKFVKQNDNLIFCNINYIKDCLASKEFLDEDYGFHIIGGESIYRELLPYCQFAYVTKIYHEFENADAYFPNIDNMKEWELINTSEIKEHKGIKYQYCIYANKNIITEADYGKANIYY